MMKQIKTLLIAAVALIGMQNMNAQSKTAHVDIAEITNKMPAIIDAQNQLKKLGETYNKEYNTMVTEYKAKIEKYEKEASTQTDASNQTRKLEVDDMGKRIGDYQENAQKELQKKEADMMQPLVDKVKASISKVGKAKGFQYILNTADLLLADGTDITPDVKKDLGF
ncbi:MAG: outer membrane protein [Flavobacterium sp.]|jgi:outer membrane protein